MRLMILSDKMIGGRSAYSKTTFELATRFAAEGHEVAHIPMGQVNKMGKQRYPNQNILIYPSGEDIFCEDVVLDDYLDFGADMLITNKEPWVFNHIYKLAINFVPLAIIDHAPVSPSITGRLHTAFRIIAISRFGQQELKKKGMESVYIPIGVRTDVYKPLDKAECKKGFFLDPDDFVIGIVAMNRVRKMIPLMLRGYKRFLELNPGIKSHLFLWTNVEAREPPAERIMGVADVGVQLLPEIFELNIGSGPNDVRWIGWKEVEKIGGLPEWSQTGNWDMVKLYNAFDVNFLCSGGEGAGLTYLEAAACGVPSVYTNYAAAPEYAGPAGIGVNAENYVILNTPGTRYYLADVDGMAEALTKIYHADREKLATRARMHAMKFDWTKIIKEHWKPFLENCATELYPKISKGGISAWS